MMTTVFVERLDLAAAPLVGALTLRCGLGPCPKRPDDACCRACPSGGCGKPCKRVNWEWCIECIEVPVAAAEVAA